MARREVTLKRIAPLSAFRVGLAFSLVGLVSWVIAVALVWLVLDAAGVVGQVNSLIADVGGELTLTFAMAVTASALFGVIMSVLFAILCPLLAVIYNAVVDLSGGMVMRLSDY